MLPLAVDVTPGVGRRTRNIAPARIPAAPKLPRRPPLLPMRDKLELLCPPLPLRPAGPRACFYDFIISPRLISILSTIVKITFSMDNNTESNTLQNTGPYNTSLDLSAPHYSNKWRLSRFPSNRGCWESNAIVVAKDKYGVSLGLSFKYFSGVNNYFILKLNIRSITGETS
jgi:hypothetical protein